MYAVVYRWRIVPGKEQQFVEAWKAGTAAIAREFGGWGSRMHQGEDGCFYAYAQWPDKATWERGMASRLHHSDEAARTAYFDAIAPDGFTTLFSGEVLADLLELRRP
jgi:heme-degrading monooxygenase HmoA